MATNCEAHLRKERNSIRRRYFRASWNKVLTSAATLAISLVISFAFRPRGPRTHTEGNLGPFLCPCVFITSGFSRRHRKALLGLAARQEMGGDPHAEPRTSRRMACKARSRVVIDLLFCARTGTVLMSPTADKTFGLYRFHPSGDKWELVSSKHNFSQVYVRDDWSIYGIDEKVPDNGSSPNPYQRVVLMSADSGRHWQNISEKMPPGFAPSSILPDPDREGLICLKADTRKGDFILQADDTAYKWHTQSYWDWQESHYPTTSFFRPSYSTRSTLFLCFAKFDNYFSYPFGDETQVMAFEIGVSRSCDLREGAWVVVPVEVTFREGSGVSVTLVDTERGHPAWELKRILPNGNREIIKVGASSRGRGRKKLRPTTAPSCSRQRRLSLAPARTIYDGIALPTESRIDVCSISRSFASFPSRASITSSSNTTMARSPTVTRTSGWAHLPVAFSW